MRRSTVCQSVVEKVRARSAPLPAPFGPAARPIVPPFSALLQRRIPAAGRRATFLRSLLRDFLRPRLFPARSPPRNPRVRSSRPGTPRRPSTTMTPTFPRDPRSGRNVADCSSRPRRRTQFRIRRRVHRSLHKLRRPPNCHRAHASVRVSEWCRAPSAALAAAPLFAKRALAPFLRLRFREGNLSRHVRRREHARADRETRLHAFLRPLPFDESRSQFQARDSTSVATVGLTSLELSGSVRRDRPVFLPSVGHGVLPPPPYDSKYLFVFRRSRARRARDTPARSPLPHASCVSPHRLSPVALARARFSSRAFGLYRSGNRRQRFCFELFHGDNERDRTDD